jgi:hypothetical protein
MQSQILHSRSEHRANRIMLRMLAVTRSDAEIGYINGHRAEAIRAAAAALKLPSVDATRISAPFCTPYISEKWANSGLDLSRAKAKIR